MDPVHGPPLQARVAAANGTVLQLANCCTEDKLLALKPILAHMEGTGGKQNEANEWTGAKQLEAIERGQVMRAVGMAGKDGKAGKTQPAEQHCRRTQPADSPPGTGLTTNGRPTVGRPCSKQQQLPMKMAGLSPCR